MEFVNRFRAESWQKLKKTPTNQAYSDEENMATKQWNTNTSDHRFIRTIFDTSVSLAMPKIPRDITTTNTNQCVRIRRFWSQQHSMERRSAPCFICIHNIMDDSVLILFRSWYASIHALVRSESYSLQPKIKRSYIFSYIRLLNLLSL